MMKSVSIDGTTIYISVYRQSNCDKVPCLTAQGGFEPTFSYCDFGVLSTRLTRPHKQTICLAIPRIDKQWDRVQPGFIELGKIWIGSTYVEDRAIKYKSSMSRTTTSVLATYHGSMTYTASTENTRGELDTWRFFMYILTLLFFSINRINRIKR